MDLRGAEERQVGGPRGHTRRYLMAASDDAFLDPKQAALGHIRPERRGLRYVTGLTGGLRQPFMTGIDLDIKFSIIYIMRYLASAMGRIGLRHPPVKGHLGRRSCCWCFQLVGHQVVIVCNRFELLPQSDV